MFGVAMTELHRRCTADKVLQWARLSIVCLTFFIDIANLGMCTIALPIIKEDLNFDEGSLQWVLTAYSLTYGGFLMIGGRLGDIFGHELMLKMNMFLFNIFTLVCALVPNKIGLVVARALQGWAAAFTIPSAQALVALIFPDPSVRALALSWWGATGSMGFVLGPIFGGIFTSLVNWRWIFWFPLIVEGFLWCMALMLIRDIEPKEERSIPPLRDILLRADPVGTALSIPGLILLIYSLTSSNIIGWDNGAVIGTLVVAVLFLAGFVLVEAKFTKFPLVPRHLWKGGNLAIACGLAAFTYAIWQGANYFLTLELQDLGFTPLQTAIRFLPLGVTAFLVNMVVPHLLKPVGSRILFMASWVFALVGIVLLSVIGSTDDYWRFCFTGMVLYIIGVGTVYYVAMVTVVGSAPTKDQGSVAGVFNMSLNVGGAVFGVAVLTVIDNSVESQHGGQGSAPARLKGYRAAYYGAIALAVLATLLSFSVVKDVGQPERTRVDELEAGKKHSVTTPETQKTWDGRALETKDIPLDEIKNTPQNEARDTPQDERSPGQPSSERRGSEELGK